jgi:hypothetical protein
LLVTDRKSPNGFKVTSVSEMKKKDKPPMKLFDDPKIPTTTRSL